MQLPLEIDLTRLGEVRHKTPVNPWDFVKFQGAWFPKLPINTIIEKHRLKSLSKEFGETFNTLLEFEKYADNILNQPTVFQCDLCDFKSETQNRLETHRDSRNCRLKQKRLEAAKNAEQYVPTHKKKAYCGLCQIGFANKYTLKKHKTSPSHKEKLNLEPVPDKCVVCKHVFNLENMLSVKRHLQHSKKCHRMISENGAHRLNWLWMHSRFNCKFDKNKTLRAWKDKLCKVLSV